MHLMCWVMVLGFLMGTSIALAAPPRIPKDFDAATVQSLLDHIEEGHNAAVLKAGYFNGHREFRLPTLQGLGLVESVLAKEPPRTRRWYLLHMVRGWAGCHLGSQTRLRGLESYDRLFEAALDHSQAPADIVQRASNDFIGWLPPKVQVLSQETEVANKVEASSADEGKPQKSSQPEGISLPNGIENYLGSTDEKLRPWKETVYRCFVGYLRVLGTGQPIIAVPRWEELAPWMAQDKRFRSQLEQELKRPDRAGRYGLLLMAAALNSEVAPDHALTYLREAKSLLPTSNKPEIRRYYERLVQQNIFCIEQERERLFSSPEFAAQAVAGQNKPFKHSYLQLIEAQREAIQATGHGHARLAIFHLLNADIAGFNAVSTRLIEQTIDEEETVLAAQELLRYDGPNRENVARAHDMGCQILQAYLNSDRPRAADKEWEARLALSWYFYSQRNYHAVRLFMGYEHLAPPSDAMLRSRYDELAHLMRIPPQKQAQ